ncbi:MFS general substrate transporter [Basidiobolus meristosporus CBS 931.73]|uniref:MFS general substrate transporter n=1 Tax=Basidiobolus meristosporus CBS 931.73 TaxID=1314790 RepID=A0A1Y1Y321_9FUNG|nr:MFS general substrate transporter [Basidiobolus meristosporus CBS 931.73]|eukprot:ORX92412.1 MFS general substrate transporter [Basidiobolus meristosporus CBS 931.73]
MQLSKSLSKEPDYCNGSEDIEFPSSEEAFSCSGVSEKTLLRKLDWHLIPYLSLLYLCSFLDRVNIGNARLFSMEESIGVTENQFAWSLSIFYVGYILFEVPSNNLLKRFRPSRWISRIMVSWGIITMCTAAVHGFNSLMVCRFLLGSAEAGFFPGIIFYLSFWYKRSEQGSRIGLFFSSCLLAGAFSGVLSFVLSHLEGVGGLHAWQWVFIVQGSPSVILGIITWFYLPDFPDTARWLSPEEQRFATIRLRSDLVDSSETSFKIEEFWGAVSDPKVWLYMVLYFCVATPSIAVTLYFPTLISQLGFSNMQTQLLSAPPYIISAALTLLNTFHSDRIKERGFHVVVPGLVGTIGYILLLTLRTPVLLYLAAALVMLGIFPAIPIIIAWLSNNMVGTTKTATATAMMVSFGTMGGAFAGQFYHTSQAPRYQEGHLASLSLVLLGTFISLLIKVILNRENSNLAASSDALKSGEAKSGFRYIM